MLSKRKKDEIERLIENDSGIPKLVLIPWCDGFQDHCQKAGYDCVNCKSKYKKIALERIREDFKVIKDFFN